MQEIEGCLGTPVSHSSSDVIDLLGHGHGRIEINSQAFYIRRYIQTAQASDWRWGKG